MIVRSGCFLGISHMNELTHRCVWAMRNRQWLRIIPSDLSNWKDAIVIAANREDCGYNNPI